MSSRRNYPPILHGLSLITRFPGSSSRSRNAYSSQLGKELLHSCKWTTRKKRGSLFLLSFFCVAFALCGPLIETTSGLINVDSATCKNNFEQNSSSHSATRSLRFLVQRSYSFYEAVSRHKQKLFRKTLSSSNCHAMNFGCQERNGRKVRLHFFYPFGKLGLDLALLSVLSQSICQYKEN